MDLSDIPPATKFQPEMLVGIEQSDNFLFLMSPDSAYSKENPFTGHQSELVIVLDAGCHTSLESPSGPRPGLINPWIAKLGLPRRDVAYA
jgi:hypothetical protein